MKISFLRFVAATAILLFGLQTYAVDFSKLKEHYSGVKSPIKALKYELGDQAIPLQQHRMQKVSAGEEPSTTVKNSPGWGFLTGPDGSDWFYSQTFELDGWYYKSSVVTIYDSNLERVGRIFIEAPEGEKVNQMEAFGEITENFFDHNSNTLEISVFNHAVTEDYVGKTWVDVYTIDADKIYTIDCEAAIYVNASEGWTNYIRFLTASTDAEGVININVWRSGGWESDELISEHVFQVEEKLINYMDAAYINPYVIDGKPYYVIPHYSKEFMQPTEDIFADIVPTEDNSLIIEVYNDKYELVNQLDIPLETNEGALFTFAGFGMFSYIDLSKGFFTGDDKLNFIVTEYDYVIENDDYRYTFNVYNEEGEHIKTIGENAVTWLHMSPIKGEEDQVALVKTDTEYGSLELVNMPSCEIAVTLPGEIDGRLISTQLDRCKVDDSYQYVIGTAQAMYDEDLNIIASIGWYTKEGEIDHYVDFNLGPNGEYFSAYISAETLNPYLIDTDDEFEYVFLSKTRNEEDFLDNNLTIANEDGSVIRTFTSDNRKGYYYSGGFINWESVNPSLFIAYINNDDEYTIDFYDMPFVKYSAGGTGTEADPYIITSVGDLQQIVNEPSAYYKLGNNIDLTGYNWTPIEGFTGHLDGNNFAIENLTLNNESNYCGFFATLEEEAVVKNLIFDSPRIEIGDYNYFVGVLAAVTIKATIENVHILDAVISGNNNSTVGGLIANPTYYTTITSCSAQNISLITPNSLPVGGLCGDIRTSTIINASYVSGKIIGSSEVGGIVGLSGMDCSIKNCHAVVDVKGKQTVGGIVGSSGRYPIINNYAEGSVEATEMNMLKVSSAAGIVGYLDSDWSNSEAKIITGNISNVAITSPQGAKAVHRIVGRTISNEHYEEGEEVRIELGLENNFAGSAATINGIAIESADNSSVEGSDINLSDTTKEFYEEIGFLFGENSTNPWILTESNTPEIYFINQPLSLSLNIHSLTATEGEEFELIATVLGTDAIEFEFEVADEEVALINDVAYEDNKAHIFVKLLKEGSTTIIVKCGNLQDTCTINALSGIESVEINENNIKFNGAEIECVGANEISVYGINGICLANATADKLSVSNLDKGIYIVVATTADGTRTTKKIFKK